MSIDKATAALLRKEFPPEAVGQLPKPYKADSPKGKCPDCGGWHGLPAAHLDYVGHAATTDRLLQVDPEWSWEPMAVDDHGLPMRDDGKNLWIRLTVCGVTRIGVGDGKSAKECIGDAIRNAAMRFGVALDLWSKEELEQGTPKPGRKKAELVPPVERTEGTVRMSRDGITSAQLTKLHVCLGEAGMGGVEHKDKALRMYAVVTGREVTSSKELTKGEAMKIIDHLEKGKPAPEPEPDWSDAELTGSLPVDVS